MELKSFKRVHCIGIGGIGVSAIARFLASYNVRVSGSDKVSHPEFSQLTKEGIEIYTGENPDFITSDIDCVIYSPAVEKDHSEMREAENKGIVTLSYPEALGELSREYSTFAVSGTNGKTTTTTLLGLFLEKWGIDPTVIVGGRVLEWGGNVRVGKSDVFVVESCEYKRAMMHIHPHAVVLTNIAADHLDYYRDVEDIMDAFSEYVSGLTEDDLLVYNIDDEYTRHVSKDTVARAVSFGCTDNAAVRAKDIIAERGKQHFTVEVYGEEIGSFSTNLPGVFNIYNILGALAVAIDLGVDFKAIQEVLAEHKGSWRRFEQVGQVEGVCIISDYAHHPDAIKKTLTAAREIYLDKRILAVFQPHHEDRTIKLFDDFVESFVDADEVILSEIYHVAGREEKVSKISSKDLARAVEDRGGVDRVSFAKDLDATKKMVEKKIKDFDVVLFMGAGDIDKVARSYSR